MRQHASKEETIILLGPREQTSIEMESCHANISANASEDPHKFAGGSSTVGGGCGGGIVAEIGTDILDGMDSDDSEQWEY